MSTEDTDEDATPEVDAGEPIEVEDLPVAGVRPGWCCTSCNHRGVLPSLPAVCRMVPTLPVPFSAGVSRSGPGLTSVVFTGWVLCWQ